MSSMTNPTATCRSAVHPAFPPVGLIAGHQLLPTFLGLRGEVCLRHAGAAPLAADAYDLPVPASGDAMSGVRGTGLPGHRNVAQQQAVRVRSVGVPVHFPTITVPTITVQARFASTVPTTPVRTEKHDPGTTVRKPPV